MKVCKAVIPTAGFGTRLLPATKAIASSLKVDIHYIQITKHL